MSIKSTTTLTRAEACKLLVDQLAVLGLLPLMNDTELGNRLDELEEAVCAYEGTPCQQNFLVRE